MRKIKKIYRNIILAIFTLIPMVFVRADTIPESPELPTNEHAVYDKINEIINWMFGLILLGAAVVVIIAAWNFLTAAGDQEKTKKARDYIVYAIVAVLVGFLAKAIIVLLGKVLGFETTTIIQ